MIKLSKRWELIPSILTTNFFIQSVNRLIIIKTFLIKGIFWFRDTFLKISGAVTRTCRGPSICHEGEIFFNSLLQLDDIQINEGRDVLFSTNKKEHCLMLVPSELFFVIDFSNSKRQQVYVVNVAQIRASHGILLHELKPNRRSFLNVVSRITKVSNVLGHFRPIVWKQEKEEEGEIMMRTWNFLNF